MTKNRNYSFKDVEIITASKIVAVNFSSCIGELSGVRSDWTEQYAADLLARIDQTIETHLGVDAKKDLREATSGVSSIQASARRDLSFFKTQIDDDFKSVPATRDEILNRLGFSKNLKAVQKGNQEALVQLLFTFKKNMTDSLRTQIVEKGLSAALIDKIIGYARDFNEANTSQEGLKQSTKEISKEAAEAFNSIYDEIIGLCKKVSLYYQYDAVKKEQFTFSKIISNLGAVRKSTEETAPVAE